MTIPYRWLRVMILIVAVGDMLAFSRVVASTLIFYAIGTVMILLGLAYFYRPASVIGLIVVSAVAASAMSLTTVSTVSSLLTALLGLFVPAVAIAVIAFSAEVEGPLMASVQKKPLALSMLLGMMCIMSAPVAILVIALLFPPVSTNLNTISEVAIILTTTAAVGTAVTSRGPRGVERTQASTFSEEGP